MLLASSASPASDRELEAPSDPLTCACEPRLACPPTTSPPDMTVSSDTESTIVHIGPSMDTADPNPANELTDNDEDVHIVPVASIDPVRASRDTDREPPMTPSPAIDIRDASIDPCGTQQSPEATVMESLTDRDPSVAMSPITDSDSPIRELPWMESVLPPVHARPTETELVIPTAPCTDSDSATFRLCPNRTSCCASRLPAKHPSPPTPTPP